MAPLTSDTSVSPPLMRKVRIWMASEKPIARIARNLLWMISGKGVGAVLSLAYLAIATRTLGVAGFGNFALILSMGGAIALFAQFDSWQAVMRFGADHHHAGRIEALGRLVSVCRLFDVAGFLVGAAVAASATIVLVHFGSWDRETGQVAMLYSLALLAAVRSTPMGVLRLHHRFDLSTYAETVVPIVRMAGTIAVLFLKPDVTGFLIAWAASELASAICFWILAWRIDPETLAWRHSLHFRQALKEEKGLARFLAVTNLGTSISGISSQAPVLLLGGFVSAAAAGLFRLAYQLSRSLAKIATLVSRSTYAELNHVRATGGSEALRKLLRKTDRIAIAAGAMLMLIVVALGKPMLWLIAGPEFLAAYPVLVILGIATAIDFIAINKEPALLASTNGMTVLRLRLTGAAIQLALLAALLPLWEEVGAAWSIAGASLAVNLMSTLAVRRHVHGKTRD
ncbi:MAG TPA: oligosaccharide flippase family protein [Sphingobium sp.]|nr:oligosaccharide flippase family protein [Sphingobium sp.]